MNRRRKSDLQRAKGRARGTGEETGRNARGWERARPCAAGGLRVLGVDGAGEESNEGDVLDKHYRKYSWGKMGEAVRP